ncbi:hypothetical protein BASA81_010797 [Batrachochytrium salamandrivorans]|nr:hypothetical protein BASA81_010770 [Batrachochytrium salamandrivorans]KAH9251386.1 hypothetical protein BASA81_010797 [Batrachochytrium salamandrivorans]
MFARPSTAPSPPGRPVAVERTRASATLAWPEFAGDLNAPLAVDFRFLSLEHEFEVRYCSGRYSAWTSLGGASRCKFLKVGGLEPGVAYVFQVRKRLAGADGAGADGPAEAHLARPAPGPAFAADRPWSAPSESSAAVRALPRDEQERADNLARLRRFVLGGAVERYPEEPALPDSYGAKAARAAEGLLLAAHQMGLGGAYMSVVKGAWRLHKTGLASLLFHADLQQTVYVLLTFVSSMSAQVGLSTRDFAVGIYFALWEAKKERLLHPLREWEDHRPHRAGVLQSEAPAALLDELMFYFPLAGMAYRGQPSHIQWTLDKFADRNFRLVMCRQPAGKFRPSFFLAANAATRVAVFAVRGTAEVDDVVTDGLCDVTQAAFRFGADSREFFVHAGMLEAAQWLVRGAEGGAAGGADGEGADGEGGANGAGVGEAVAKLWAAGYRRVVFCGHSLGGGVSVLAALLLADRFRELELCVYAYGTPAVVDEALAEACKGRHAPDPARQVRGLGARVTVKNLVRHDDVVPRLSLLAARDFAQRLKETRSKWEPLLSEDIGSFAARVRTAWAPRQRAHALAARHGLRLARGEGASEAAEEGELAAGEVEEVEAAVAAARAEEAEAEAAAAKQPEAPTPKQRAAAALRERLERSLANPLVVPGLVCHTYEHHGAQRASLVDFRFAPLRRIAAFANSLDDHRLDEIMAAARGVRFADEARARGRLPPHWESLQDHQHDSEEWRVTCRVCAYPVSWHQTSSSEAMEIRATHHCHGCGRIACSKCSEARAPLPHLGILAPVRVCDLCKYRLFGGVEEAGEY